MPCSVIKVFDRLLSNVFISNINISLQQQNLQYMMEKHFTKRLLYSDGNWKKVKVRALTYNYIGYVI